MKNCQEKFIQYNTVARLSPEKIGICPIEIMERKLEESRAVLFSLLDISNDQLDHILSLNKTDKKEFAELVDDHIIVSPKFVMN